MPTYEYECTKCGSVMELFQSITAKPKRRLDCATCKKPTPVRRLIGTGGGIVFKGSGFYTTDYRSDSYKKAAESEKPAAEGMKDDGAKKDAGKPGGETFLAAVPEAEEGIRDHDRTGDDRAEAALASLCRWNERRRTPRPEQKVLIDDRPGRGTGATGGCR